MPEESPLPLPPAKESMATTIPTDIQVPESAAAAPERTVEPTCGWKYVEFWQAACEGESFYKAYEGVPYCILHYPDKEKALALFAAALKNKLQAGNFNFIGVHFPDHAEFREIEFSATADFTLARFHEAANFQAARFNEEARFNNVIFYAAANYQAARFNKDTRFNHTIFSEVNFDAATFGAAADFRLAILPKAASFRHATFEAEVDFSSQEEFRQAIAPKRVDFRPGLFAPYATYLEDLALSGKVTFSGRSSLDLQFARFKKPEWVTFHTVMLRPHWFVNVDPRKFVFSKINWNWDAISIKDELQWLEDRVENQAKGKDFSPQRWLETACRQLAENAEVNNRYEEASRFRYWAMHLLQSQKWAGWAFRKTDWLHTIYWVVSGCGESIKRAFIWLFIVWAVFALFYLLPGVRAGFEQPFPLTRAFSYSLGVMSLQKPDLKPLTDWAHLLVTFEAILGPVQAALLALAIRRKFMR